MSFLGLGSKKSKSTSYIDPKTQAAQWGNYDDFSASTPATYTPVNEADIQSYFSPYRANVIANAQDALERSREMAVNHTADQATAAHAFGGSRHGVAEALTNDDFARQGASMFANLEDQGWQEALQAAAQQKALQYQYPLTRQQTKNQTLGSITPQTYGTGKTQDPAAAFSNFGKVLNTAAQIASFF